uniref:Uncharacterized protein n=1 Tax=Solanum tuberosum TaxID=4113 RepID=M1DPT5_SOLTU
MKFTLTLTQLNAFLEIMFMPNYGRERLNSRFSITVTRTQYSRLNNSELKNFNNNELLNSRTSWITEGLKRANDKKWVEADVPGALLPLGASPKVLGLLFGASVARRATLSPCGSDEFFFSFSDPKSLLVDFFSQVFLRFNYPT